MANEYQVLFGAKLDQRSLDSAVKNARTSEKLTISNFHLDTNSLTAQIQNALKNINLDISFSRNAGNIVGEMQRVGQQAGQAFNQGMSASAGNAALITKKLNSIRNSIKGTNFKFDTGGIENLERALMQIDYRIEDITAQTNGKTIKLNISGRAGEDAVKVAQEFNAAGEKIGEGSIKIKTAVTKANNAINEMTNIANRASKIKFAIDTGQINSSVSQIKATYQSLATTGHSSLSQIKTDIQQLEAEQKNLVNARASGDSNALVDAYERVNASILKIKSSLKTVKADTQSVASSLQIQTLDAKIANWMAKNSKATKSFGSELTNLRERLAEMQSAGGASASELKQLEKEFLSIKSAATAAGLTGKSFVDSFKGALQSITRYISASTLVYHAISWMKEAYTNVYGIDKAMTELKKVTDETANSYQNFLGNAKNNAKEIGTTITDYINSTADFARLGNSLADSQKLAKTATIYSVVGDEISGIDEATKSVVSTMSAFKVQTDDSMSIVDKFNEVGNNFAISSGGIGEALERSASSLATANNSLDQSIALVTAANTVVQDPESVGTAFKTITMRIRGARTELEEAGLDADGMAESTAKLREEIKALSGVDIMKDENTFKSTYDIMDELAKKWQSLTDIQRASITELIGGKRQGNIISSLMTQFNIARKALQTSANSEGSATREHEKWLESMEAKTQQFQATWEGLSQDLMDDSFLKGLIDTGTNLLSVIDGIVDGVGALPVLLTTISGIMSGWKNIGRDKSFSL